MPAYRLLFFERGNERLFAPDHTITLFCEDDLEAARTALELSDGRVLQLWRAGVLVRSWPAGYRSSGP